MDQQAVRVWRRWGRSTFQPEGQRVTRPSNGMGAPRRKAYNCKVFAQNDPHDVEVAMKYVLLGNLSPEYASKQSERVNPLHAGLLRFRRHRRCPQCGGDARVLRLVLHPASGADPKHAGLRPKELRNGDQGRDGLSAWRLTALLRGDRRR